MTAIFIGTVIVHGSLTPISFSANTRNRYSAPARSPLTDRLVLSESVAPTLVQKLVVVSRLSTT